MAIWLPDLTGKRGPKYLQIVEALADDIKSGRLSYGAKLPPHRELAYQLDVSPNTTSRAYSEAVERALIRGEVGRGTFVRGPSTIRETGDDGGLTRKRTGPIDLSRNLPLPGLAGSKLAQACAVLGQSQTLSALADYQTESDSGRVADACIEWLRRHGVRSESDRIVISSGAQHGVFAALTALTRPGDLLLTEALTYAPVKAMAARLSLKIAPVAIDEDGVRPDELDRICSERSVKALYITPTLQTPTGRTMKAERRRALSSIARRHDILLIEDDVFGLLHRDRHEPVAMLAPERTIYITSASKCLAPGLRVGLVCAPTRMVNPIRNAVNLTCWMPPPLMTEIFAQWIQDGTSEQLTEMQIKTAHKRQQIAQHILGGYIPEVTHGLHFWLTLPDGWSADQFTLEASDGGVKVTNGTAFAVAAQSAPNAIRICLSHEADESRLKAGLEKLRAILDEGPGNAQLIL
ncbi:PLP-dependent aminotransferase family protein [Hoeflea sp. WL0058]|uniref:PLP-dependent aminotransferase family protein n=1 Tax=Flavimaribacter sediminis TaxID=2865987 RepID=A0AAE3CZ80_9HYPH|nr:PLP-dependent aminotransferase family protein [Flavimaribacter sediminis]MBW8635662.1 PLP-dependent aminotransferase family protein [Flavimaribacter sediminis]